VLEVACVVELPYLAFEAWLLLAGESAPLLVELAPLLVELAELAFQVAYWQNYLLPLGS